MLTNRRLVAGIAAILCGGSWTEGTEPLAYDVRAEAVFKQLRPHSCWFHPRVAPLPGHGKDGQPAVLMTIQKHLAADDHYSGLYFLRTNDLGKTWTGPTEIAELAWRKGDNDETIAVCDVTPGWHARSGKLLAIGIKLRYSPRGEQLLDKPRSHECAYATYDPRTDRWTPWKMLAMPDTDGKFFLVAPGCVQWLEQADGSLLVPTYFKGRTGSDYSVTVLHCSFDGQEMKYIKHGDELTRTGGRGYCEPSLAHFQGKYYLTLRNDARAYVATSTDGLHFAPVKPWTFDDGQDLGSYNTQAHWLVHSGGLFLTYTRRGAGNDHVTRNRAPLFVAQVDPATLQVIRKTEKVLLPERGVMLGNFGATSITPQESWVTDAEFILGTKPHARGADGTIWLGRVQWAAPNKLVKAANSTGAIRDVITITNSKTLGAGAIPCERIPLGEPDDYKPCIAQLPSGELLLTAFHQHRRDGGKVMEQNLLFRSKDGGRTWSNPEKLGLLGREPYLTVLSDGTLFMTGHLLADDVRNRHGYTHGYLHRSTDAGKTWDSIRIESEGIKPKASNHSSRNVLRLPDGTLLLGVDYDGGDGPYLMWRSTDNGKTWDKTGKCLPKDFKSRYGFFGGEAWLWLARSGKIWALVRVDSNELPIKGRPILSRNDQSDHFILFASGDGGKTFDRVRDFGDYGEMYMSILRLQNKRLLLTFTVRDLHPPLGVRAIPGVETDDGFEFDFAADRLMLDTRTPVGKAQGGGFGPTVQLRDGTLVTSYSYRGADDKTHLEVVRWNFPKD